MKYDAKTGLFWKGGRLVKGHVGKDGYWHVGYLGDVWLAHRLAWFLYYGQMPVHTIDHINGDRLDNRIDNLRDVPASIQNKNAAKRRDNKSGFSGVHQSNGRWRVQVKVDGVNRHVGMFDSFKDAVYARRSALRFYKYHPNHGRESARYS